jgi:hypothetical protein
MKTYTIGYRATKGNENNSKLMVTIDILPTTDTSDLKRRPKHYKMPFFQRHLINCGKFSAITSIDEKTKYESAKIYVGDKLTTIHQGSYFYIKNYDYSTGIGIIVYPYKYCILNMMSEYIGHNYSGTVTKFYDGGNIYKRIRYCNGDLTSERIYSNNEYNTALAFVEYQQGRITYVSHYDDEENMLGDANYDENGNPYNINNVPPSSYIMDMTEIANIGSTDDCEPDISGPEDGNKDDGSCRKR